MKLYVEFTDHSWIIVGEPIPTESRIISIQLTPEQEEKLERKKIVTMGGKDYYETRRPICFQEEAQAQTKEGE